MGRDQPPAARGQVRRPAREGRRAPRGAGSALRRRCLCRRRPVPPDRRPRRHRQPLPRALREDDVHHADRRGARSRSCPTCSCSMRRRSRPTRRRTGRAPGTFVVAPSDAGRGADRRHVLRGRDQEVDLHGHERPPAARRRPADALLCERRRGRQGGGLLRPLGNRQDDPVGRPGALADRRRRARLGRERRLQHRGRLLRQGDPPLGRGRAGDLPDDEDATAPCSRTSPSTSAAWSTSTTTRRRRTRARPTSSSGSRTPLRTKMGGHPTRGRDADRRRVRDPAADREADAATRRCSTSSPASPRSSREPRSASRSRSRRSRPASARRSCRNRPPSTRGCSARSSIGTAPRSGSSTPAGRAARTARATGCRSRRPAGSCTRRSQGELDEVDYRVDDVFGFEVPGRACPASSRRSSIPRSTWRDPDVVRREGTRARCDVQRELRGIRRGCGAGGHRRRPAGLTESADQERSRRAHDTQGSSFGIAAGHRRRRSRGHRSLLGRR